MKQARAVCTLSVAGWIALACLAAPAGAMESPAMPAGGANARASEAWTWHHGLGAGEINALVNGRGLRILDLRADVRFGRAVFDVAVMADTGERAWSWSYDLTPARAKALLEAAPRVPIALAAYELAAGDVRLAALWGGGAGAQTEGWLVLVDQTAESLTKLLAAGGLTPDRVSGYPTASGQRYAMLAHRTAGNRTRGWHHALGADELAARAKSLAARVVDLEKNPAGSFDALLERCGEECPSAWRSLLEAPELLARLVRSEDARILLREALSDVPPGRFVSPLVQTLGPGGITARVAALLAVTDGTQGLYLKEVGGGVLANQNESFAFEPASTIKAAPALHVMQQVEAGNWSLNDLVDIFQPTPNSSCPSNTDIGDEMLANAMREMLWHSDNQRTRVIVDTFGQASINATMSAAGMASSSINHVIGCGGPPENQLTLVDAGVLYEGVADGTLVTPGNVDLFRSFFAGKAQFMVEGYDWTGIWDTDIPNMIFQEAPAGMTSSQRQSYRNQMDVAYKAGNYKICVNNTCSDYRDHISIAGWAEVPFCTGTLVDPREFGFGIFIYNSTSDATSSQAFNSAKGELLREQIHDGMATCFHAELSLASAAAPDPVLSGDDFTVTIDADNAGPMEAAVVSLTGVTPPGTTFSSAVAAPGWATSAPASGGTGAIVFSDNPMLVGASPQFQVELNVDCAVPDATTISYSSAIGSVTPDDDPSDNSSTAQVVVSNPAPVIGPASASPAVLWPPNHKLVNVVVSYSVTDNCGTPTCALSAVSSEPDNGLGDGDKPGDIVIVDDHNLMLRAERSGNGPGRTYTITATCQDSGGGSSSTQTTVVVPHNK